MTAAKRPVVVGLGEVLWDIFPDETRFGGAPANFTCAVAGLSQGVDVFMASGIGSDELGRRAREELSRRRVDTLAVISRKQPTGTVHVSVDGSGHASYEFAVDTAWDSLTWSTEWNDLAKRASAVCFGTLGQRSETSREAIQRFVSVVPDSAFVVFDINLRPPFFTDEVITQSLTLCNVLKLNDEELPEVARLSGLDIQSNDLLAQLARRWSLQAIAVTQGADGATIWHKDKQVDAPGIATAVVDTVGAGDCFTAAMVIGLLRGDGLQQICDHACAAASFVCGQPGATPEFPASLQFGS